MPQLFYYLLKVIICSGILFGYYHLFLRNKVYHAYNRFYLLAAVVLAITVPLLNFDVITTRDAEPIQTIQILQAVNSGDAYLEEILVESHNNNLTASDVFTGIYTLISFIFFLLFIFIIMRICLMIMRGKKQHINSIVFIPSNAKGTPFSFFHYLFWNPLIELNSETGRKVFAHELAHITEKHSLDKTFINLALVVFWINPFFWFIRKELSVIHEFIADKKAVGEDADALATMILKSAYPQHNLLLSNHFFYSSIKRRIHMLAKYKSSKAGYIARIIALPVIIFISAAFTLKATNAIQSATKLEGKITVVIDAGHGGQDGGAFGSNSIKEKDITLQLSKRIKQLNQNPDINIVLTRASDIYMTPQEKAAVAEKAGADLFISVHVNTSQESVTNQSGMEIFIPRDEFKNAESSKLFASSIISEFKNNYSLLVPSNPMQRQTSIWVLQNVSCPAVLIEAGYINNKNDLEFLLSEFGQTKFALNIINAISAYASAKNKTNVSQKPAISDQARIITDMEISVNDFAATEDPLFIINGKEYSKAQLADKNIRAKTSKFYGKDNIEMINRYGKRAANGVVIMEKATIKSNPGVTDRYKMSLDSVYVIDASENVPDDLPSGTQVRKEVQIPVIDPLYLINGKIVPKETFNSADKSLIKDVEVLLAADAVKKYGESAANGSINAILNVPTISLSGFTSTRIHIDQLKNIKEIVISHPDYVVKSATIYFAGAGFPYVQTASVNSGSLERLMEMFQKTKAGTSVTLDNVRITKRDGSGEMTVQGKGFQFIDDTYPPAASN